MSIFQLVKRTSPFIMARLAVYAIFAAASFVLLGIMLAIGIWLFKSYDFGAFGFIILMVLAFVMILSGLHFVEKYILYMVKVGHVSVITEILRNGDVPEGKGQVAFGKDQVMQNFGSANVCFAVDKLIYGSAKQIQRWMMKFGDFLSFIPGSKVVVSILNRVLAVSLNYVDEAILSYIMLRKREQRNETVWKSASDGVVMYAQSWKQIITTAAGVVAFVFIINIAVFFLTVFPLIGLAKMFAENADAASFLGFIAIIGAYVITVFVKRTFVDPIATVAMIRAYQLNVQNIEPAMDLQQQLLKVSRKFRDLFGKSESNSSQVSVK